MRKLILYLSLLCQISFLLSCAENDKSDLVAYVNEVKSRKAGKIEPLPEFVQYKMYAYQSDVMCMLIKAI